MQRDWKGWPSGDSQSIAVLRLEPEEISAQFGVAFSEAHDDLDYLVEAPLALPSGRWLLLVRYKRNQQPGTEVRADKADNASAALAELLTVLGIDLAAVSWTPNARAQD